MRPLRYGLAVRIPPRASVGPHHRGAGGRDEEEAAGGWGGQQQEEEGGGLGLGLVRHRPVILRFALIAVAALAVAAITFIVGGLSR